MQTFDHPHDPAEVFPYSVTLGDLTNAGVTACAATVSVESMLPFESSSTLIVNNVTTLGSDPLSSVVDTVKFWLQGGTDGTTYVLLITPTATSTPLNMVTPVRAAVLVAKQ
jgi:hypothetical protein